ncbi:N-acetyltransferase family protein [Mycetocola tolaasinivorans]|uniref:N-acetyltransferase family protein n=1 Tax=Mycetocola tolaasinivorans TaxID=76635 RepID=A0A3L7A9Q3_9MICO|nr:GNAT family N-acetyltransferase [Mycetocola tolaasinivorans]RLP76112.1 N-acetyltransferase family protein [Mycetocola tolaasinivorans]
MISLRPVRASDAPGIAAIYDHYVATTTITFDEVPRPVADWEARIAKAVNAGLPFLVAVDGESVLGYALVSPWSDKSAFRFTVEHSIYLAPAAAGQGLGSLLLGALLDASTAAGLRQMVAVITDEGTEASLALHRRFGFTDAGALARVGFKFDRWVGVRFFQRELGEGTAPVV